MHYQLQNRVLPGSNPAQTDGRIRPSEVKFKNGRTELTDTIHYNERTNGTNGAVRAVRSTIIRLFR